MQNINEILNTTGKGSVITLKGYASLSLAPDTTVISLEFSDNKDKYADCLKKGGYDAHRTKDMLESLGLDRESIKTVKYTIEPHREYNEKDKKYYYKGFDYVQEIKFKFKNDNKLISKILTYVANNDFCCEVVIGYEVSNQENFRTQVIRESMINAKNEAMNLLEPLGFKIVGVTKISDEPFNSYDDYDRYDGNHSGRMCGEILGLPKTLNKGVEIEYDSNPNDCVISNVCYVEFLIDVK